MADTNFNNYAVVNGSYDSVPFVPVNTTVSTVLLANIRFEKSASSEVWFQGELGFTITITNNGDKVLSNLSLTDTINRTFAVFVDESLEINGFRVPEENYNYNPTTGLLELNLIPNIPAGESSVITFRVAKA